MKKTNLGTAIYSLVVSIIFLFAPLFTLGSIISEVSAETTTSATGVDNFFRFLAVVMVILAVILLVKDKVSSTAGKILLIIGGASIILFSSFMGTVAGILGIIGAALLLASNKRYLEINSN